MEVSSHNVLCMWGRNLCFGLASPCGLSVDTCSQRLVALSLESDALEDCSVEIRKSLQVAMIAR
jgi:hypothetical protein